MSVKLVIFDMAGTTVGDEGGAVNRCLREALAEAGLTVDSEAVDEVMGLRKPEALRLLIERSDRKSALIGRVDEIHRDFVARMVAFYETDPSVAETVGISRVFQKLRAADVKVALNTGFSRDIAQVILDRMGWVRDGLIDASVTSDEVSRGRPHPYMIRRLMVTLGVADSKDVAKVGDAPADLEEGANARCGWVVGVAWGTHELRKLERFPHTHLVETVADLLPALGLEPAPSFR